MKEYNKDRVYIYIECMTDARRTLAGKPEGKRSLERQILMEK
jgi:hypothetical protein